MSSFEVKIFIFMLAICVMWKWWAFAVRCNKLKLMLSRPTHEIFYDESWEVSLQYLILFLFNFSSGLYWPETWRNQQVGNQLNWTYQKSCWLNFNMYDFFNFIQITMKLLFKSSENFSIIQMIFLHISFCKLSMNIKSLFCINKDFMQMQNLALAKMVNTLKRGVSKCQN